MVGSVYRPGWERLLKWCLVLGVLPLAHTCFFSDRLLESAFLPAYLTLVFFVSFSTLRVLDSAPATSSAPADSSRPGAACGRRAVRVVRFAAIGSAGLVLSFCLSWIPDEATLAVLIAGRLSICLGWAVLFLLTLRCSRSQVLGPPQFDPQNSSSLSPSGTESIGN